MLDDWSGSVPLRILSFFFYKPAADRLQKTFEDIWRSLCFQMLAEDRDLCKDVLTDPTAPFAFRRLVAMEHGYNNHWLTGELKHFFLYLLTQAQCKLFLLLDGLDEFDESQLDLLHAIQALSCTPGVKICCASRPDAPFNEVHRESLGLKVQDLTRADIRLFVRRKLSNTKALALGEGIVWHAQGVFLWAHVVSEDICRGLSDGADMAELEARITDIGAPFHRLLGPCPAGS